MDVVHVSHRTSILQIRPITTTSHITSSLDTAKEREEKSLFAVKKSKRNQHNKSSNVS